MPFLVWHIKPSYFTFEAKPAIEHFSAVHPFLVKTRLIPESAWTAVLGLPVSGRSSDDRDTLLRACKELS